MQEKIILEKGNPQILGITVAKDGYNFALVSHYEQIELNIYRLKTKKLYCTIFLDEKFKIGNVFSVVVKGLKLKEFVYEYCYNGQQIADLGAKNILSFREFMSEDKKELLYAYKPSTFDWEEDKKPNVPMNDMIIYKLHTRGFTMDSSSKVSAKGTYKGIVEKIPYLQELGITTVELFPIHNFEDLSSAQSMYAPCMTSGKNYWGYSKGDYYIPKPEYASTKGVNYIDEFKNLVKELHKNNMEIILEMHFEASFIPYMIIDVLRYWVMEYHIDGIRINCDEAMQRLIKTDPILNQVKIFATYFNRNKDAYDNVNKKLVDYNDEFLINARRFLKGDEDHLREFANSFSAVSPYKVNYIACQNSFTLMDTVSYDKKHNEENGENNRDGQNYNYSWNCGEEGPTKKKKVIALRKRQIKNALIMVFLSRGIPLLMAGDEFGNSQKGNNNPYCIDSKLTWLDWKDLQKNKEIYEFCKALIAFRKQYISQMSLGMEVSFHGKNAWCQDFENSDRDIGIMYADMSEGKYIYIGFNMHWEERELALPNLKAMSWNIKVDTSDNCKILKEKRRVVLEGRTAVVLVGESNGKNI